MVLPETNSLWGCLSSKLDLRCESSASERLRPCKAQAVTSVSGVIGRRFVSYFFQNILSVHACNTGRTFLPETVTDLAAMIRTPRAVKYPIIATPYVCTRIA